MEKKIKDLILHQVRLAKKANLDAIVCDGNSSKLRIHPLDNLTKII